MTNPLRLFAIAIPLALSACSPPPITIEIEAQDGRLTAKLSQDWGFIIPRREAPCIRAIELHSAAMPFGPPIWAARRNGDDSQCTQLAAVILGVAPSGFAQAGPLPGDLQGAYELTVRGTGFGDTIINLKPKTHKATY